MIEANNMETKLRKQIYDRIEKYFFEIYEQFKSVSID